ncbi:MAG: glycosyltransferase family 39 protein [Rhodanobacter sp.]|nr:glycosyltransferase family 39 protein [Rhodanobacter sp.]
MTRILWGLIVILNLIKFLGTDISPPGFYIDEALGAAHVICIKQTGADYYNVSFPLFSVGGGGGYYTAPYLYGEVVWTSIWGNSTAAFRSFCAFVTLLTILFLVLYVRKKAGDRTALWVALLATVSPWAFQFSRIAWDPPVAPMFLMAGLYLMEGKYRFSWLASSLALAGAAYAYPPMRIQLPLILILLPGTDIKSKAKMLGTFLVLVIPIFLKSMDPMFTARARYLALTSNDPGSPYRTTSFIELFFRFIKQILKHFSLKYMIVTGDRNLRHSTRHFGILSWVQFVALIWGLIWAFIDMTRIGLRRRAIFWTRLSAGEQTLLVLGVIGTLLGIAPAAMTWEGIPHALRSIGAWPFLCILAGVTIEISMRWIEVRALAASRLVYGAIWVASLVFFGLYLNVFFNKYASESVNWFLVTDEPSFQAYGKMMGQGLSCADVRSIR